MDMDFPATAEQLEAIASSIDLDDNHIELVIQTQHAGEVTIKFPRTRPDYATLMYISFAATAQVECVQGVLQQCNIKDEVSSGIIKLILIGLEVDQRNIFTNTTNAEKSSSCHGGGTTIDLSGDSSNNGNQQ